MGDDFDELLHAEAEQLADNLTAGLMKIFEPLQEHLLPDEEIFGIDHVEVTMDAAYVRLTFTNGSELLIRAECGHPVRIEHSELVADESDET